jgi:antitoxin (DNA-binding transcriptional repressor) of toxin-antitoxin stability system
LKWSIHFYAVCEESRMKASVLDLRRRMKDILKSLRRNEPVTLLRRGKLIGTIHPPGKTPDQQPGRSASDHVAFGMWKDRPDLEDVNAALEKIRGGRSDAF